MTRRKAVSLASAFCYGAGAEAARSAPRRRLVSFAHRSQAARVSRAQRSSDVDGVRLRTRTGRARSACPRRGTPTTSRSAAASPRARRTTVRGRSRWRSAPASRRGSSSFRRPFGTGRAPDRRVLVPRTGRREFLCDHATTDLHRSKSTRRIRHEANCQASYTADAGAGRSLRVHARASRPRRPVPRVGRRSRPEARQSRQYGRHEHRTAPVRRFRAKRPMRRAGLLSRVRRVASRTPRRGLRRIRNRRADRRRVPMEADSYYLMQVDLREWEGITFWARRGPDSQPGFRVALGDRNTDDDASMLATAGGIENPRCRRAKECDCRNHRPCTQDPNSADYFCWDPDARREPRTLSGIPGITSFIAAAFRRATTATRPTRLCRTLRSSRTENVDHRYVGTASCNTYTFKNDITRMGCFDAENGPPPPESSERCGDPWFAPVRLSTDWQFFRVPFSELRQEGYGKEFPALDKSAVTMVRFTWSQGWVDYWIDDVRFYRESASRGSNLSLRMNRLAAFTLALFTTAFAAGHARAQDAAQPPSPEEIPPPAQPPAPVPAPGPDAPGGEAPQNPETPGTDNPAAPEKPAETAAARRRYLKPLPAPEAAPASAAEQKPTDLPKDELEAPGYIPGYRRYPSLESLAVRAARGSAGRRCHSELRRALPALRLALYLERLHERVASDQRRSARVAASQGRPRRSFTRRRSSSRNTHRSPRPIRFPAIGSERTSTTETAS